MYELEKIYLEGRIGLSRERTATEKGDLCVMVVRPAILLGRRMKRDLFVCPPRWCKINTSTYKEKRREIL